MGPPISPFTMGPLECLCYGKAIPPFSLSTFPLGYVTWPAFCAFPNSGSLHIYSLHLNVLPQDTCMACSYTSCLSLPKYHLLSKIFSSHFDFPLYSIITCPFPCFYYLLVIVITKQNSILCFICILYSAH